MRAATAAHHRESVGLAERTRRGTAHAAQGRHRHAGRPAEHHRVARLAARPCRRRARHAAPHGVGRCAAGVLPRPATNPHRPDGRSDYDEPRRPWSRSPRRVDAVALRVHGTSPLHRRFRCGAALKGASRRGWFAPGSVPMAAAPPTSLRTILLVAILLPVALVTWRFGSSGSIDFELFGKIAVLA
jgi:hypothetical protein